jgi:hypothetical protein
VTINVVSTKVIEVRNVNIRVRCSIVKDAVDRSRRFENAETPNLAGLLGTRRERPCRRATDKTNELAPPHSITSSARAAIGSVKAEAASAITFPRS